MLFSWPIKIIIFEIRNNNVYVVFDRAKMKIAPTGEAVYLLKKKKVKTRPMKYEDVMVTQKGKSVVTLISPSRSEFFPISAQELIKNKQLIPIDEDLKFWYATQVKEASRMWLTKLNLIQKFIPAVLIGVTVFGIILMLYFMFDGMTTLTSALGGLTSELSTTAQELTEAVRLMKGIPTEPITPPPF